MSMTTTKAEIRDETMATAKADSKDDAKEKLDKIDLDEVRLDPCWSQALPSAGARRLRAIALCKIADVVLVATCNPRIAQVRKFVSNHLSCEFRLVSVEQAALRRVMSEVYRPRTRQTTVGQSEQMLETVELCDELLAAAQLRGASDIHLVPGESEVEAKFRVDGRLEGYRTIDSETFGSLVSRLKVISGLNIAEKMVPQDGRFTLKDESSRQQTDVRVATIPTRFGERVSLRLLHSIQNISSLQDLGMGEKEHESFAATLNSSTGLVLLTGPTGSGKTTTLTTAIKQRLQTRGGNVVTIEDPVEYEIPGTTQVEVTNSDKLSFPQALRSILRHDPDVIMIGEIRDSETADLAIKASLTGHLVLSTLHTNSAAGVVPRLIDMGVKPFMVAATLRLAVAQRLVRQLCPKCRTPARLSAAQANCLGVPDFAGREIFEPVGCIYCAGKGFVGRTALFEMLRGGQKLADHVSIGATEGDFVDHMRETKQTLLLDDGIHKILSGATTAQEVIDAVVGW